MMVVAINRAKSRVTDGLWGVHLNSHQIYTNPKSYCLALRERVRIPGTLAKMCLLLTAYQLLGMGLFLCQWLGLFLRKYFKEALFKCCDLMDWM